MSAWLTKEMRKPRGERRKKPYYSIQWREGARIRTRGIGYCNKAEANRLLKIASGKLAAGEPLEPPARTAIEPGSPATEGRTLSEYIDDVFLPVVQRDKAPKTHETMSTSAKALKGQLGTLRLEQITFAVADAYVSARKKLGRKSRTVQLELRCLRQTLQHAEDCGVIERCPKLPTIKVRDAKPHRYLTVPESIALLEALRPLDVQPHVVTRGRPPIRRDRRTYLAVLMGLNLGMRRDEILTRGWEDVLWRRQQHGVLLVRAQPSVGFKVKKDRERALPLSPELSAELTSIWIESGRPTAGWVFPSPRDASKPRKEFRKALKRACERAGIPPVHPHGLRHSWASRLAMAGVPRNTLLALGGWVEGRVLDRIYAHVSDDHMADVMSQVGIGVDSDKVVPFRVVEGG